MNTGKVMMSGEKRIKEEHFFNDVNSQSIDYEYSIPISNGNYSFSFSDYSDGAENVGMTSDLSSNNLKEVNQEIDSIKEMLLILTRDQTMEQRFPELKKAYDHYQNILKKCKLIEKLEK